MPTPLTPFIGLHYILLVCAQKHCLQVLAQADQVALALASCFVCVHTEFLYRRRRDSPCASSNVRVLLIDAALGCWPQHESHPGVIRLVFDYSHDVRALVNTADVHGVTPLHVCTDVRHQQISKSP